MYIKNFLMFLLNIHDNSNVNKKISFNTQLIQIPITETNYNDNIITNKFESNDK